MNAIYALVDPRTGFIRYVGKTSCPLNRRLAGHINDSLRRRFQVPRFRWIGRLLNAGLRPEIVELEQCEDWQDAEQFWISYLRFVGCDLLNATAGGDGTHGHRHKPETKERQRLAAINRCLSTSEREKTGAAVSAALQRPEANARLRAAIKDSHNTPEYRALASARWREVLSRPEVKAAQSAYRKGRKFSEAHRHAISQAAKGRKMSPAHRAKLVAFHTGRKRSAETRAKISAARLRHGAIA